MKRDTLEAVLFLPAMALLAGAVFVALWLVMKAGNAAVHGWHALFRALGLPYPVAMAFTVITSALTIYALFYGLGKLRRRKAGRQA